MSEPRSVIATSLPSYGYDAFGSRGFQTTATSTTIYPFKRYSVASSTGSGAKYATTTEYVFNGDSLVATIDQQLAGGAATGSPQTRYIHPDHLGSTNVVTDENGGSNVGLLPLWSNPRLGRNEHE